MTPRPTRATRPRVTVVGDTLLDIDWAGDVERICPDAPVPVVEQREEHVRPGGAGLAAVFAAGSEADVTLVTALGPDAEGDAARELLGAAGVRVVDLGLVGPTPVKLRVRSDGQSLVRVDRGCDPVLPPGAWVDAATDAIGSAAAVMVSDYGRGMAALAPFAALLTSVEAPVVWDPHVQGRLPPEGLDVLVPNRDEARTLAGGWIPASPDDGDADEALAARLARKFDCPVAMTIGARGAIVAVPGAGTVTLPVDPVAGDPCGAGDRFAATVAVARAHGTPVVEAAASATGAARRHVVSGSGGRRASTSGAGAGPAPFRSVVEPAVPVDPGAPRGRSVVEPGPPVDPGAPRGRSVVEPAVPVDPGAPRGRSAVEPDPPVDAVGLSPAVPRSGRRAVAAPDLRFDAPGLARAVRAAGGRVVVAGGCFDVLHAGHVRLLAAARRLGDCLIVCLNSDLSVRRLKGRHRPVNPVGDRVDVLEALAPVDAVHVFDEDDPSAALEVLRPHLFVKGADHADGDLPERAVLEAWGGEVVFVPVVPGRSTTRVLEIAAGTAAS